MATADTPAVAAGCDDTYLIDYLFELNGYLIIKGAVSAADLAAMNAWADAHAQEESLARFFSDT